MSASLSVVIPTRGFSQSLNRCVRTLARQWSPDFDGEIIIVDDGSGNSFEEVLLDQMVPVRLVRIGQNSGPGACRNRGVAESKSTWIAFVDDDCLLPWGWLQRVSRLCSSYQQPCLVGGRISATHPRNWFSQATEDLVLNPSLQDNTWHIVTANAVVHRAAWLSVEGFDPRFRTAGGEDWDFSARVSQAGFDVIYDPDLWCYHENPRSFGPFLERAVRYGTAHALWLRIRSKSGSPAAQLASEASNSGVSLLRRKVSFLLRTYRELRGRGKGISRSLRSATLFALFMLVFDLSTFRESRRLQSGLIPQ